MIERLRVYDPSLTEDPAHILSVASFVLRELHDEPDPDAIFMEVQLASTQSSIVISAHDSGGLIVATAGLRQDSDTEATLVDVATARGLRGSGIGRAVIDHTELTASTRGIERLTVRPLRQAAGFYAKLGFSESDTDPRTYQKNI